MGESAWTVALQPGEHRARQCRWIQLALLSQTLLTVHSVLTLAVIFGRSTLPDWREASPIWWTIFWAMFGDGFVLQAFAVSGLALAAQWFLATSWMHLAPPPGIARRLALGILLGLTATSIAWWGFECLSSPDTWELSRAAIGIPLWNAFMILSGCVSAAAAATIAVGTWGIHGGASRSIRWIALSVVACRVAGIGFIAFRLWDWWGTSGIEVPPFGADLISTGAAVLLADSLFLAFTVGSMALTLRFAASTRALREPTPRRAPRFPGVRALAVAMFVVGTAIFAVSVVFTRKIDLSSTPSEKDLAESRAHSLAILSTCMLLAWTVPWVYARDRRIWKAMLLGPLAALALLTGLLAVTE